jgi:SOS response regulatory protein OraA/RecX
MSIGLVKGQPPHTFVPLRLSNPLNMKTIISIIITLILTTLAQGQDRVYSSSRTDRKTTFRHSNGISSFNVEMRGKIELTDNDKDIKSMSADGYLEITKTVFGSRRSIVITPDGSGLKREYYEGRTKVAFEPNGRKWLSEIMTELVRSTTIGAESRVNRFYKQGGANSVVNEIKQLESDYVKAHYASLLMKLNVPVTDYGMIASNIASTIESDHYVTEFLKDNMAQFMQTKEATEALFAATRKMESDHYKTEVIKDALISGPASLENVKIIMEATGTMDSDHYKTEVLTSLLKQSNLTDATIAEMINTTKSIGSDHYRSVVLNKALAKQGLSATSYQRAIESIKDIESDHYKAEVLTNLLQKNLSVEALNNLLPVISSIESDHYITNVANEIVKRQSLSDESFQKLMEAVSGNGSDHYMSVFLQTALERPSLTKQNILSVLQATSRIGSDHYITEVLTDAAYKIKAMNDPSLKEAYRVAAKRIESETYYGRAIRAIE